jgi:phospholipid/cholesterol/gamma-HCH transport system ATP-binding protein
MTDSSFKIQVHNLYKSFGTKHVLQGVDLNIPQGKSLVILGGSGTGKSVLIKSILGLVPFDRGQIKLDGEKLNYNSPRSVRKILDQSSMLFQGGALFDSLPIWKNVAFGLIQRKKIRPKLAKEMAAELLKEVGLSPDILEQYPSELSGGMQKRVSLARSVATNPEIIFFDEPTTGLDPIMADVINNLISKCVKRLGATAITITHDMSSVYKIADNVAFLRDGKIDWHGSVQQMKETSNQYLYDFINGISEQKPIINAA